MDQDPDENFSEVSDTLRDFHNDSEESYLKLAAFWDHVERVDDRARVELGDASKLGNVRRMLTVEHAKPRKQNENVEPLDDVDIEICAYAIYA